MPQNDRTPIRDGLHTMEVLNVLNGEIIMPKQIDQVYKVGRSFFCACVAFVAYFAMADIAAAETYPSKVIKVINPWPPGGGADILVRALMIKLSERLGQPIVIENRAGASGVIGSAVVAKSAPDGYTLLFSHVGPIAISPAMQADMPYDSVKDFAPVTQVVSGALALTVRPELPVKTLQELVAYCKTLTGKSSVSYGSIGVGSTTHLAAEMLQSKAGITLLHVPYKGTMPVITDMLGGQIDIAFHSTLVVQPYLESGKLRGIAVTTLKRSGLLPNLPAIAELYPGYEVNSWYGVMAPARTPKDIVARLQKEIAEVLKLPDILAMLKAGGLDPEGTTPEQHATKIKEDMARWAALIKTAGLAPG